MGYATLKQNAANALKETLVIIAMRLSPLVPRIARGMETTMRFSERVTAALAIKYSFAHSIGFFDN